DRAPRVAAVEALEEPAAIRPGVDRGRRRGVDRDGIDPAVVGSVSCPHRAARDAGRHEGDAAAQPRQQPSWAWRSRPEQPAVSHGTPPRADDASRCASGCLPRREAATFRVAGRYRAARSAPVRAGGSAYYASSGSPLAVGSGQFQRLVGEPPASASWPERLMRSARNASAHELPDRALPWALDRTSPDGLDI